MRIENTSEAQRHLQAGDERVVVPGRRDGVNGSVEVSKAFADAAKADIDGYVKDGVFVLDGPKSAPAPVKTDEEKAAANVAAVMERAEVDRAAASGKDKSKK
jgi:hypothetical protein